MDVKRLPDIIKFLSDRIFCSFQCANIDLAIDGWTFWLKITEEKVNLNLQGISFPYKIQFICRSVHEEMRLFRGFIYYYS